MTTSMSGCPADTERPVVPSGRAPMTSAPTVGDEWTPSAATAMRRVRLHPSGTRRVRRLSLVVVVLLVVFWMGLLPQQLGGRMSYVITDGSSMLPRYHTGDLVLVREQPTYHVGEVAAFHNHQLHVIVLHRIVAIRGDRFVFKGDNNNFDTSYEPTRTQIVGAEWLHLPGAGRVVLDLRDPAVAAVLLGVLWLFSFSPAARSRRQRRRHRHAR